MAKCFLISFKTYNLRLYILGQSQFNNTGLQK